MEAMEAKLKRESRPIGMDNISADELCDAERIVLQMKAEKEGSAFVRLFLSGNNEVKLRLVVAFPELFKKPSSF